MIDFTMLKCASTLVTTTVDLALKAPADLMKKVDQKSGALRGLGRKRQSAWRSSLSQSNALERGDLTLASETEGSAHWNLFSLLKQQGKKSKARELLDLFTLDFKRSVSGDTTHEHRRVLFYLTSSLPFTESGYTIRSHELLRALREEGVELKAVTRLGYPGSIGVLPRTSESIIDGIPYALNISWFKPANPREEIYQAVRGLVEIAREFQPDVLHTTTDFKNALVVSRAAKILDIPWIYEARGELEKTWVSKRPPMLKDHALHSEYFKECRRMEESAADAAARLIVLSETSRRGWTERRVESGKIEVLPNAISNELRMPRLTQDDAQKELGLVPGRYIGTVTSVVSYEGLDTFLRAIPLMQNQNIRALIVGDGDFLPNLKELAARLGIQNKVIFAGKKPHRTIQRWYEALDVFVIPRKNEEVCRTVTPIKALKAQALGVPVVASDLPALREVTGGFARFTRPDDPASLAAEIDATLQTGSPMLDGQSDELPEWMQLRTWAANARHLKDIYENL